jgi:hypothetical protein
MLVHHHELSSKKLTRVLVRRSPAQGGAEGARGVGGRRQVRPRLPRLALLPTCPRRRAAAPTTTHPIAPRRPQRGVVILPGLGNNAADYEPLAAILRSKGLEVETVQVRAGERAVPGQRSAPGGAAPASLPMRPAAPRAAPRPSRRRPAWRADRAARLVAQRGGADRHQLVEGHAQAAARGGLVSARPAACWASRGAAPAAPAAPAARRAHTAPPPHTPPCCAQVPGRAGRGGGAAQGQAGRRAHHHALPLGAQPPRPSPRRPLPHPAPAHCPAAPAARALPNQPHQPPAQAGGWLGRVYLLDFGTAGIDRYVTLGSPHAPPPPGAAGVVDQTRGILTFCSQATPGAYHDEVRRARARGGGPAGAPRAWAAGAAAGAAADLWLLRLPARPPAQPARPQPRPRRPRPRRPPPHPPTPPPTPQVKYVTVAGRFVKGAPLSSDAGLLAKFAGFGYQQVRGPGGAAAGWVGWALTLVAWLAPGAAGRRAAACAAPARPSCPHARSGAQACACLC